ncbi:hypothetical protein ACH4Q7_18685 [Streptomyces roseolus]|uniref:hypothetical protein n=1 Tax=Streptomyces roseolus TaxID=67358 RepID=UPI0037BBBE8C
MVSDEANGTAGAVGTDTGEAAVASGTAVLLAAAPAGRGRTMDAASVLPALAAVPPGVLTGTATATLVELADPIDPQTVLTRLRAAAQSPGPLVVYLAGQLHLDRRQQLPHLALARSTTAALRYTAFPWHWLAEAAAAGPTTVVADLVADPEAWSRLGTGRDLLRLSPSPTLYARVTPPPRRGERTAPDYLRAWADQWRAGVRAPFAVLHTEAAARTRSPQSLFLPPAPQTGEWGHGAGTAAAPAPGPAPVPVAAPAPGPVAGPVPAPVPVPGPGPVAGPAPVPGPAPVSVRVPGAVPAPAPAPVPVSARVPEAGTVGDAVRAPAPGYAPVADAVPGPVPGGRVVPEPAAEPARVPVPEAAPVPAGPPVPSRIPPLPAGYTAAPPVRDQPVAEAAPPAAADGETAGGGDAAPEPGEEGPVAPEAPSRDDADGVSAPADPGAPAGGESAPGSASEAAPPAPAADAGPEADADKVADEAEGAPGAMESAPSGGKGQTGGTTGRGIPPMPSAPPAPSAPLAPPAVPAGAVDPRRAGYGRAATAEPAPHDPHPAILSAAMAGRHAEAAEMAAAWERDALRRFGPRSAEAVHWMEVRADLARLAGEPARSCELWLAVAEARLGLRQQPDDRDVEGAVDRAHHQWEQITEPARARALGPALLALRRRVPGRRPGALEALRRRMHAR